jgi:uncharacterized protein YjbI with pentapeptide repeats
VLAAADLAAGPLVELTLRDADLSGQVAEDALLDRVVGLRVRLGECHLTLAQLLDVRLEGADLAGGVWEKPHLRRVEIDGCRAIGLTLSNATLDEVRWRRCNGEHLRIWSSSLRAVRFEGCVLREASFVESDLSGAVFRRCDMSGADLRGARLAGADLRGSNLTGAQLGIAEIRGAIVDPAQAVHLAGLLGVTVEEEPAEPA